MKSTIVTKDEIMDVASQYFFDCGFKKVTVDKLARTLGISKKTIYKFFRSKDSLILQIIQRGFDRLEKELESVIDNREMALVEKLKELIRYKTVAYSQVNGLFVKDVRENLSAYSCVIDKLENLIPRYFGRLLAEGQQKGLIRKDISKELVIEVLYGAMDRVIDGAPLKKMNLTPDQALGHIFDICLKGILVPTCCRGEAHPHQHVDSHS